MYLPILHSKVQCTCKWSMMTERSRMNIKKNDTRNCTRKYKAKTVVHTAHCIGARTSFVRSVCSTRCAHNVIKMQVKGSHSEKKIRRTLDEKKNMYSQNTNIGKNTLKANSMWEVESYFSFHIAICPSAESSLCRCAWIACAVHASAAADTSSP